MNITTWEISWVWKYVLWHLTSKTWLIRANRNHACNIGGSRALNIWFRMTFRLCCVLDGEQEYLNRNLEYIHCMCFLAWPMGFLTSSLQEGFISEFRSHFLLLHWGAPVLPDFSNRTHFSQVFAILSLLASQGRKTTYNKKHLCFCLN